MKRKDSVFLFNAGVHYLIPLNFTTYQLLIDNIIKMLGQETGSENKEKKLTGEALSIWRTNTALEGEHFLKFYHTLFNYTECRFYTNAVRFISTCLKHNLVVRRDMARDLPTCSIFLFSYSEMKRL